MTPEEIGQRFVAFLDGGLIAGNQADGDRADGDRAEVETSFGTVTVTVPAERYADVVAFAKTTRGLDFTFFDFLTGVDEAENGYGVVTHLYSPIHRHHVLLRTVVPNDDPRLPSLSGVFAGANWHERETWEMFGIVFDGHPNLVKLLLSDEFEGHPLRKEFLLASRVVKQWPGGKEPGE